MENVVLFGDSIFDNAAYTFGDLAVIDQLRLALPPKSTATLLAVDGHTTRDVITQIQRLPANASHLVLSIGGNDALDQEAILAARVGTVIQALDKLSALAGEFQNDYKSLIVRFQSLGRPLLLSTIFDHVPGLPGGLKTALALFNDVILRVAMEQGLPVLDLRMICKAPADYSVKSPIEPSSQGGAKIAAVIANALVAHDFGFKGCRVYV